ncbi:hypothetical protein SpCBS45565_g04114 [Spizellomyces sp. 'palustris']|nr:hypothetical protein SpCBS45565_g04114 [Spizellomyces sp. 'palustris']
MAGEVETKEQAGTKSPMQALAVTSGGPSADFQTKTSSTKLTGAGHKKLAPKPAEATSNKGKPVHGPSSPNGKTGGQKWSRGGRGGRGGRGRATSAARGGSRQVEANLRPEVSQNQGQAASSGARPHTASTAPAQRPRGRDPVPQRKSSISFTHSHGSGSESESDKDSTRSSSPAPPAVPLTFWTPMIFLCPMPHCPPSTEPTTNPTVALDHLRTAHGVDVKNAHHVLPYLDRYIEHWAKCIREQGIEKVGYKSDHKTPDGNPVYILGHDSDLEDKVFREKLQRDNLNQMLKIQERERNEESHIPRKCLFCKVVCDSRTLLFRHMFSEHGFNIGLPDNLVEVSAFLETLQTKLAGLQCLYCEKIFKTSAVLRKHMRKKKHFKINPRNRGYDRFYIINYLEPGKNWEAYENERYESDEERKEEEWEDWNEPGTTEDATMCLFDECVFPSAFDAYEHMKNDHHFDLREVRDELGLDFYGSIKLINYIRKQTSLCRCYACGAEFEGLSEMTAHMKATEHFSQLPDKEAEFWTDPQYLFPCYENDPLLMFDVTEDNEDESDPDVAGGEEELRRIAIAERVKAEEAIKLADVLDGNISPGESDVIVLGVDEVKATPGVHEEVGAERS